ncbi:MarR family winged helix-turn-helix transcriptional regulator [Pseudomonas sp. Pseusp122]|uniref:MarR family winged helix-turn-helix transcriptional regulator n=1 Tax=unclassified Pseudomonas TaxID=196821 RepID=UPI0039A6D578
MGMLLGRTNMLKDRVLDKYLEPYGVTSSQFKVLIIIAQFCVDTPAELCRSLSLDSGSMTRMLDRLEQKGLLARSRSVEDRRQVRLLLTDEGTRLTDLLPTIAAKAMNEMLGCLEVSEVVALEQILTKVLRSAEDEVSIERLDRYARGDQ